jgi:hypothetical protein
MSGMRTTLLPFALTLILLSTAAQSSTQKSDAVPEGERGSALFRECKAAVKVADESEPHSTVDLTTGASCIRYFDGFTEALAISESSNNVCLRNYSLMTVIHVYVRFMETEPKFLDSERWMGAYASLLANYRCKK